MMYLDNTGFFKDTELPVFVHASEVRKGDILHNPRNREVLQITRVTRDSLFFKLLPDGDESRSYYDRNGQHAIRFIWIGRATLSHAPWSWLSWVWGFLLGLAAAWVFYRIVLPLSLGQPLIP